MHDEQKTKAQLIAELDELRNRLAQLQSDRDKTPSSPDDVLKCEQRFRSLVESFPIGVRQDGVNKETVYANPAMAPLLGYSSVDDVPADWIKLLSPESYAVMEREYAKRLAGKASSYEVELVTPAGDRRNLMVHGAPLISAEGEFQGTIAAFLNITEYRQIEQALRQSQAMLQSVFRSAPVGIGVVSNRRFQWVNERLLQMTGYAVDELIGNSSSVLYPSLEEYEYVGREKYEQIRINGSGTVETRWLCKDGQIIDVLLSSTPMDLNDLSKGVVFTALDITERKQSEAARQTLQEQLQQSQKMESIGQLAGGVAHDFNNLLSIILGYADMILRADPSRMEKQIRARVQEIQRAGERARALTRQLLAFGRKQLLQVIPVNVNSVVLDLEEMLRRLIGENIKIIMRFGSNIGSTKADPSQLEQVLLNVCINARDAMPDGGILTIETSKVELDEEYASTHADVRPGRYVMLAISDTGCGMDDITRQRLFEPFYTTKEKGKGSGLGLATVYGIIKQHGGHVSAYSEQHHGSTIRIYLPETLEASVLAPVTEPVPLLEKGDGLILVVEDDEAMRELACSILNAYGYKTLDAASPSQALSLAAQKQTKIDLMLTDVIMPEMNGCQLYKQAMEVCSGLRVLYMSGYTEAAIAQHGVLSAGAYFIQKPFTAAELLRKVQSVLTL